jgi:hypothetical protein
MTLLDLLPSLHRAGKPRIEPAIWPLTTELVRGETVADLLRRDRSWLGGAVAGHHQHPGWLDTDSDRIARPECPGV